MFNKFMKTLSNMHKGKKGMTGLETAIILIAFVTVAAVFGYAVLSAGLFSSERAKETVYAGLNEAKSAMEISGSVIGLGDNVSQSLTAIKFTLRNATMSDNPVDMTECNGTDNTSKTILSLTTQNDYFNQVKWSKVALGTDNTSNLLEPGLQFEITIDLNDLGYGQALTAPLGANDQFNIQVKPSIGSSLTIQRQLPPAIIAVMDLH
jgi:flagellin FlaB